MNILSHIGTSKRHSNSTCIDRNIYNIKITAGEW